MAHGGVASHHTIPRRRALRCAGVATGEQAGVTLRLGSSRSPWTLPAWSRLAALRLRLLRPEVVSCGLVGCRGEATDHGAVVGSSHASSGAVVGRRRGVAWTLIVRIFVVRVKINPKAQAAAWSHWLHDDGLSALVASALWGSSAHRSAYLALHVLLRRASAGWWWSAHATGEEGRAASWTFLGHFNGMLCYAALVVCCVLGLVVLVLFAGADADQGGEEECEQ
mmetsp:Transcript_12516/g.34498  ORF Transcript_12516/g.34498 Transcript_12516/m.34498 type:complete len:224 (+) Transcript_12516:543-1214(+)